MPAIEAPITLAQFSRATAIAAAGEFSEYSVEINTAQYDGNALYYLEVVALVGSASDTLTIGIRQPGGADLVTVQTSSTVPVRLRAPFTPVAGSQTYLLSAFSALGITAGIASARVIVVQDATASITAYDIPLGAFFQSAATGNDQQLTQADRKRWLYTAANWENATFYLDAVGFRSGGSFSVELYDETAGAAVANVAEIPGDAIARARSAALTLVDGHEYSVRINKTSTAQSTLYRACLRVVISDITLCEVYRTVAGDWIGNANLGADSGWTNGTTNSSVENPASRQVIDLDGYGNVEEVYFEGTGQTAAASGDTMRLTTDTDDSGAGTAVAAADLSFTAATPTRVRSADILANLVDGNRYMAALAKGGTAGQFDGGHAWLIFRIGAAGTAPAAPSGASAAQLSAGTNRVTWTDNASDETAFVVERAPDSGGAPGAWTELSSAVAANATQYDDATATPGSLYWYRVKARNAVGDSAYSTTAAAVTTASGPTVTITAPSVGAISVTAGTLVRIEGTATDPEDGDLAPSVDVTSSNTADGIGGDLGTGLPINIDTTGWAEGARTITVTATDSDLDEGSDSFTLTIGAAPTGGGRPGINRGLITTG